MSRIGELDLPDRLAPVLPRWITQLAVAIFCAVLGYAVRLVVDSFAPSAGPFSLGYPAVLAATLFGRWQAGLICALISVAFAWYAVLPVQFSFAFADSADIPRLAVNAFSYAALVALADRFRVAVRHATEERDRQIAERDLFLQEFDHRVKNNFAVVASMLDLQRRRADEPSTRDALGVALSRVESIARAHRHLYRGRVAPGEVEMRTYLNELSTALAESLALHQAIQLDCHADSVTMERDRAVSIGLVVNELVTNAAKHAFRDRETGRIEVSFRSHGEGWRLIVADDGVGMSPEALTNGRPGGLGQRLIDAFARQAGGSLDMESDATGTRATLDLRADP